MPWILFGFGVACALATAISLAPPRRPGVVALATWPVGWLIAELPLHLLATELGIGFVLVVVGGAAEWPGWIGLAGLAGSALGLRQHLLLAAHATHAVERGLAEALGRDYHDRIDPGLRAAYDPTIAWLDLALVFPFRPRRVTRIRNLEYGRVGKRALRLDIYRSARTDLFPGPRPVFVYVHGGGWVIGSKGQQGRLTVHDLAAGGWVCVSIDYRLSPNATFPDHLLDVKRALAWVAEHVADYGGDPEFVIIGGGSAGAHLASLAALTAGHDEYQPGFEGTPLRVQGCVCYYGIYDFTERGRFPHRAFHDLLLARVVMKRSLADDPDAYREASPVAHVGPGAPPFLVIHGDRDNLAPVEGARRFCDVLRDKGGGPCAYVELPGAQHAFELFPSLRSAVVVHGVHRFCQAVYSAWRRDQARTA